MDRLSKFEKIIGTNVEDYLHRISKQNFNNLNYREKVMKREAEFFVSFIQEL